MLYGIDEADDADDEVYLSWFEHRSGEGGR